MTAKRIVILGSTGSIGRQALEIVAGSAGVLRVVGLAAGRNGQALAEQARQFTPEAVALAEPAAADHLEKDLESTSETLARRMGETPMPRLLTGPAAMVELVRATRPDLVLTGMVGALGVAPSLAAIECGADLAIANKESLVMAGALIIPAARKAGVNVLPVDSEHSAIFQCLQGQLRQEKETADETSATRADETSATRAGETPATRTTVAKITLTASGGPFRTWPLERVERATLAEVLNHPTWQMGHKVTIDSATLMNKALEVIEAHWLFGLSAEQIEVLIHPESVVHGCVEFTDGSVLAQLGVPSMLTPIGFALYYPRRAPQAAARLDLAAAGRLNFERPDPRRYPALELGYKVIRRGGTAGAVLNAANEVAVEAFVAGRIPFGRIVPIVANALDSADVTSDVTMDAIAAADAQGRQLAATAVSKQT